MRYILSLFLFTSLCISSFCLAGDLVISNKLMLQYSSPKLIVHTQNSLIIKYKEWWFAHEIVDSSTLYAGIDLSDNLSLFIRSIFNKDLRKSLPDDLAQLSKTQAHVFGVSPETIGTKQLSTAEVIHVFDPHSKKGNIFIIEELQVHRIDASCTQDEFKNIVSNIKER